MSIPIKNLLKPFIKSHADWKKKLLNEWDSIVGSLAHHATIEKIYQDTIVVGVYDSCWLQELYLLSPTLLHTINQSLDQPRLKQIRFRHTVKKKPKKQEAPQTRAPRPTTMQLSHTEQRALDTIQDASLKKALKSFLIRCHHERTS